MSAAPSFRDPAGFCVPLDGHILRVVAPDHVLQAEEFLRSACGASFLIPTRLLSKAEVAQWTKNPAFSLAVNGRPIGAVFEHEPVPFPGFPHEWTPQMLYAAAELTLELAASALAGGYELKDAAPQNILFRGPKPIFVDLLSFEPRVAGECVWKPYAQFVRAFLLPLLANKYWGVPLADIFTTRRDGFQSEELYTRCTWMQKLRPPFLTLISLPTWLAAKGQTVPPATRLANDEKALFIVQSLLKRSRRTLRALKPANPPTTGWTGYMGSHSYEQAAFAAKEAFVRSTLTEFKPARVLDVGANTGHFSRMAASLGARVVAIDSDAACMGRAYEAARTENLDVLSLTVDIARPTPAIGWRNRECASFLDRTRGQFDAVLMLALAHHLLVTERVPLPEIIALGAELTQSWLLIEFVPRDDSMFQQLLRGRDALFAQYNRETFETECARRFEIVRSSDLPGTARRLYLLKKK